MPVTHASLPQKDELLLEMIAFTGKTYQKNMVELVGLEPTASSLRTTRSPN
jgi:hypothetical protein